MGKSNNVILRRYLSIVPFADQDVSDNTISAKEGFAIAKGTTYV